MSNETRTLSNPLNLGWALPLLAVAGFAGLALIGNEACSSDAGCVEGARAIWSSTAPEWIRKALRSVIQLVLNPWLWGLMIGAALIERLRPARPRQPLLSNGLFHDAVAWFVLDKMAFGLLVGMVFSYSAAIELYQNYFAFLTIDSVASLPVWAKGLISFVVSDFLNWLHHLVRHKVPAFWIFHAVHHSQHEMNLFTDDRVHPFDRVIAMPIALFPMLILELDIGYVPWLLVLQMLYTHHYHANLRIDWGPLRYLLVTPQSHRVHHSRLPEHADKNFGVIFSVWDRLFGTQMDAYDEYPLTGVEDPSFPMEQRATVFGILSAYVQQFFYPFVQIWRRITTGQWQLPAG